MTQNEFAEALSRLVGEAEDAGLDRETVLAVIEDGFGPGDPRG